MATWDTGNGGTTTILYSGWWLKPNKPLTIPFSRALQAFPPSSLKEDGLLWTWGRGRTRGYHKPRDGDQPQLQGTVPKHLWACCRFYCRRARARKRDSSLPMEVRNIRAAALETCVMVFYNLALYNVVLTIKDLKGWAWIYLFIYLFEFHLVSSLQVLLMQVTTAYMSSFINCVEKCYI